MNKGFVSIVFVRTVHIFLFTLTYYLKSLLENVQVSAVAALPGTARECGDPSVAQLAAGPPYRCKSQSTELTRGPPELVQHFRL
jgi:hypothetical protein